MKFTLSWSLEHLETNASLEEIADKLTHIGLEVEDIIYNAKLAGFIVVQVLEVAPHPNSYKLKLCKVGDGSKVLQIVCGALNVRVGIKTVLASIGSTLPESDFTIKPAKIRGVLSEGMLCSAPELALIHEEGEGIIELSDDYKVGEQFFNCDPVIDINVTPNRGDCLGVYGIARDLAATGIGILKPFTSSVIVPAHNAEIQNKSQFLPTLMKRNSSINVKVTDGESFISGTHITNVKNRESPKWLKDRLESIGIRSISAIVDVTNYIMISFGRPMHAYDAKKIEGELIVRKANSGEKFTGLNDKEYLLNEDISVVSDDKKIHAIAGVIGGKCSECSLKTTDIFLESAWFNPISITKSSRQLGIFTDSSYRFARSVDPEFTLNGLSLATQMILELCGGEASSVLSAGSLDKTDTKVNLDCQDINKFGGVPASPEEIFDILTKLGFSIDKKTENNWDVRVPSWRPDVTISADLVEEVVRIYGFDKIKEETLTAGDIEIETNTHDDLRILMASRGFYEMFTWSFMSESTAKKFGYSDKLFIIDNPFNNNFNIMRPSLIPNLLQIAADNIAHGTSDLAVFEIGPVYDSLLPKYVLSGIRSGNNLPRNHYNTDRKIDVFDAKADLMTALEFLNVNCDNLTIEKAGKEHYHPGKSGTLSFRSKIVGHFGEVHPNILDFFDIKQKVAGFELILEDIENLPLSRKKFIDYKYQSVKRDFAFIVNKDVAAGNIINMVKESSELIKDVLMFDIYHGNGMEPNKMSVALSVTFCSPTHTLTEEEIQKESSAIVSLVRENTGGVLRYR